MRHPRDNDIHPIEFVLLLAIILVLAALPDVLNKVEKASGHLTVSTH